MLKKFGKWNIRDIYRLPVAIVLWLLTLRNYALRKDGLAPDEWYWADAMMWNWGYAINTMWRSRHWW